MADIIELLERRDEQGLVLLKEKYADYCYSVIYHQIGRASCRERV